jgi:uncharacterized protein YndB with AHSA1/START domain
MKWVKISLGSIVGLILLVTVGLAVAGQGADANRIYASVVIKAKPQRVWPWLTQPEKVKQWVSWLVEIRSDGNSEPHIGAKSVWVMEDRNNNNARMSINGLVEAVEPNRRLVVSMKAPGGFQGTNVYTLSEQPDGSTKVGSDARYTFDNAFARFMTPVVCWQARKKMVGDMEHMRALIEGR